MVHVITANFISRGIWTTRQTKSDRAPQGVFRSQLDKNWTYAREPSTVRVKKYAPTILQRNIHPFGTDIFRSVTGLLPQSLFHSFWQFRWNIQAGTHHLGVDYGFKKSVRKNMLNSRYILVSDQHLCSSLCERPVVQGPLYHYFFWHTWYYIYSFTQS